jgi:hypothetical protein
LKTINKENWLNEWAMKNTGREVYKYMARPNSKDSINTLKRKDQTPSSDSAPNIYSLTVT